MTWDSTTPVGAFFTLPVSGFGALTFSYTSTGLSNGAAVCEVQIGDDPTWYLMGDTRFITSGNIRMGVLSFAEAPEAQEANIASCMMVRIRLTNAITTATSVTIYLAANTTSNNPCPSIASAQVSLKQGGSGTVTTDAFPGNKLALDVDVHGFGGSAVAIGQQTSANSIPVVLASDQSSHPVTQGTSPWTVSLDSNSLPSGSNQIGHVITDTGSTTVVSSVTNPVTVIQPTGSNLHVDVDNFPSVQAVSQSGTWTVAGVATAANQSTEITNLTSIVSNQTNSTQKTQIVDGSGNTLGVNAFPVIVSLGNTDSKTIKMLTGTLVTTSTTADQVVLTYTVTTGKTFYMQYFTMTGYETTLPGNSNPIFLGTLSFESPAGTKLFRGDQVSPYAQPNGPIFSEPMFFSAGTVVRIVVTPSLATSFTWIANIGGYEK